MKKSNPRSFFRYKSVYILWIAFSATNARFIAADFVILRNGATIEGRCLNSSDKNATEWQIETKEGLEFSISRSDVKDIRPSTQDQKKYAEALATKGDSLEVHRWFVETCLQPKLGLDSLAHAHRERIVELDPSDRSAWAALDYVETPQGWIPRDMFQKRRGLQKKGSRYYVPQDLAIQQSSEQATQLSALMSKKVDKAFIDSRTRSPKAAEALQFLNTLQDPFALKKLREILKSERDKGNVPLRLQLIEIISRIHTSNAVLALIDTSLFDPDHSVRGASIAKLSEYGREMAVITLLGLLSNDSPSKDNPETYERVSEVLAVLGDERCIPRLIDCLVTDHIRAAPAQPGINAGAQANGNMQFSQGSPKPERVKIKNEGVLATLQSICQGQNYGFDVQAWRTWYANTYAAPNPNVLRDP